MKRIIKTIIVSLTLIILIPLTAIGYLLILPILAVKGGGRVQGMTKAYIEALRGFVKEWKMATLTPEERFAIAWEEKFGKRGN